MSSHQPSLKPSQIIKILSELGFVQRRVTGSHHIFRHPETGRIVVVPIHGNKNIKTGTLRSILKQANLTVEDLVKMLKK